MKERERLIIILFCKKVCFLQIPINCPKYNLFSKTGFMNHFPSREKKSIQKGEKKREEKGVRKRRWWNKTRKEDEEEEEKGKRKLLTRREDHFTHFSPPIISLIFLLRSFSVDFYKK